MTTGQEFLKLIKPIGAALFLLVLVLFIAICFTAGNDPISGYSPPQDMEYYGQNPEALAAELSENVLPELDAVLDCYVDNGSVTVLLAQDGYAAARAAILHYFDKDLLTFIIE